jgi:hypothetical protein
MADGPKSLLRGAPVAAGIALIFLSAYELHRMASDPQVTLNYFFNGDTLYPAALCQDLAANPKSVESWRFTGATDIYPDVLIYAAAWKITDSVAPAMVVCSCTLFVLLVLSVGFLLGSLTDRSERQAHYAALLSLGALFLSLNALGNFGDYSLRCPLMFTCHGGSTICVVSGLAMAMRLLFAADVWRLQHRLLLAGLFAQTALCMASDRLILVQLVLPGLGALVFARVVLGNVIPTVRVSWIGGTLVAASVIGQVLLRLVQQPWEDVFHPGQLSVQTLCDGLTVAAIGTARQLVNGQVLHSAAVVTLAVSVVFVAAVSWRRVTGRLDARRIDHRQFVAATYYLALCVSSIGAATLSGMLTASAPRSADYQWTIGTRYLLPVLLLPFFMLSYTVAAFLRHHCAEMPTWPIAAAILVASTGALLSAREKPHADGQDVWHYYPANVRELDEAAVRHGVRDGFADHHSARVFTLLSRQGLRVRAVVRNPESPSGCGPYPKLGNVAWYSRDGFAPSFIVLYDDSMGVDLHRTPAREELVARFGEPAETASIGGLPTLFYHRSDDEAFRQIPLLDFGFIRESYSFKLHEVIHFPGQVLPSKIVGLNPLQPRLAEEGRNRAGVLTDGPDMTMRKRGVYRVRAIVSAKGTVSNGRLEVALIDAARDQRELCGVVSVPLGERQELTQFINVDDRLLGRLLSARVHYHGVGTLEVHAIEVERSP